MIVETVHRVGHPEDHVWFGCRNHSFVALSICCYLSGTWNPDELTAALVSTALPDSQTEGSRLGGLLLLTVAQCPGEPD